MRVSQWWSYLVGYLTVRVEGQRIEPFINMAMVRGIRLWDIRHLSHHAITARVRISGFFSLRHIARKTRCRMRIVRRHGLPFLAVSLKKRKMLALGAVFFLFLLYFLSSLVWFVEVVGNQQVATEDILRVAQREGFRSGTPRWRLDKLRLEKVLAREFPLVAIFSVEIRGTRVLIEVVEKKLPPPQEEESQPSHIVAARSGVIEDLIVLVGEPVAKPGDTVRAGQMLISGILPVPGTGSLTPPPGVILPPPLSLEPERVCARGLVRARVLYTAVGESPVVESNWRPTGRRVTRLFISGGGREVIVYGPREAPYPVFAREQQEVRIPRMPLLLTWERLSELEPYTVEYGLEGAAARAAARARAEIDRARMPQSEILSEKIDPVPLDDPNRVRVRVQLEAMEDIGIRQAF